MSSSSCKNATALQDSKNSKCAPALKDTNTQVVVLFNSLSQNYQLNAKVFSRMYPRCTNAQKGIIFLSLSQDY